METIESPDARAAAGQVVIEVEAAEVLFLDTQLRSGWGQEFSPCSRRSFPETEVFSAPESIEPAIALAALHDGSTALEQLDQAAAVTGKRVLITGATGSLGHWLILLLAATGATVIGAARGAAKLEYARDLGADEVVDYSLPGWADQVGEIDVVFDGVGGEIGRSAYKIIKPGGRFLGYGAASGEFAAPEQDRGVTVVGLYLPDPVEWRELPVRALKRLEAGTLRPTIGGRFVLTDAAAAHAAVEARTTRGKTILVR